MENLSREIKKLKNSIKNFDAEAAKKAAQKIVEDGVDPMVAVRGMSEALKDLGDLLVEGKIWFPQMYLAVESFDAAMRVMESHVSKEELEKEKLGTIVIGTVDGDLHDMGMNMVAFYLKAAGFEVYNLGMGVPAEKFVDKAVEVNADIIGMSSLLWANIWRMREVMEELKSRGLRDRFKVLIGGGSLWINPEFAERIGADGAGHDAFEALELVKKVLGK